MKFIRKIQNETWAMLQLPDIRSAVIGQYMDALLQEALENGHCVKPNHCSSCRKKRRFKKNAHGIAIAICDACVYIIFRGTEPTEHEAPFYYVREKRKTMPANELH